ncbi:MAG: hypothetical protein WB562_02560 [Candidatus Sulfotelmatobacter sp.]
MAYMVKRRFLYVALILVFVFQFAHGQDTYLPNQEVRIDDLPAVKAQSKDASAVLLAAIETVLHDKELCCGKDSALEDSVLSADPLSLQDVSVKLQGRHHLSDGRPIVVTAEYVPASSINSGELIKSLRDKHALLMQWNSHVYVLYGTNFYETIDYSTGSTTDAIRKLLLLDPRFSYERRQASFNRETDDWQKVQGFLRLTVALP